jgi:hypothetical protein
VGLVIGPYPVPSRRRGRRPRHQAAAAAFGGYLRALALVDVPARVTILQGEDIGRPGRLLVDLAAGERARPGIWHRGPDSRLNPAR